jgi:hypothetical protein
MEWPILTVLNTGTAYLDQPFNYFFSLMIAMTVLLFVPCAIFGAFRESMKG